MSTVAKAIQFADLHQKSNPIVLFNIWDAGGAKTLADAGANAIATGSWSVAAAQGFADGEKIPLGLVLTVVERILASVDLPVTVDFEGGYAEEPQAVADNVHRLLDLGVVGINFEDGIVGGSGLHSIDDQAARIRAIRRRAEAVGIPLFINARTDLFLTNPPEMHASLMSDALARAVAYERAGATGVFVPGLNAADLIAKFCSEIRLPVNVMLNPDHQSVAQVAALGVSRVSLGPQPYANAQSDFVKRFTAL